jgi:hypothetical protein
VQVKSQWPRCPSCKTSIDTATQRPLALESSAVPADQNQPGRRMTLLKLQPLPGSLARNVPSQSRFDPLPQNLSSPDAQCRSFSLAGVPRPPPLHGRNMPVTQFSSRSSPAARPRTTGSEPAWEELEGSHLSTALGAPLGVQVTEITFCSNCKAPMKRTWDRCPGCKTPATASLAPTLQVQLQGDLGYLLQVPGAMESPRGAGEAAPRGEMIARQHAVDGTGLPEELTRQRQHLGFSSTCTTCNAPVKLAWPQCPSCRTQLHKLQVPGAMESPQGAGEAAPRGEMIARQHAVDGTGLPEELTRQRQLLGFRSTCTTCNAPVKPAWPRCPSCRTPLHKMGVL